MNVGVTDCPLCMDTTQLQVVVRFQTNTGVVEEHIRPHEVHGYMHDSSKQNVQLLRIYCEKHRIILEPITY